MKYEVNVKYYVECEKILSIYGNNEGDAEEKALDIVSGWSNVADSPEPEVIEIWED